MLAPFWGWARARAGVRRVARKVVVVRRAVVVVVDIVLVRGGGGGCGAGARNRILLRNARTYASLPRDQNTPSKGTA